MRSYIHFIAKQQISYVYIRNSLLLQFQISWFNDFFQDTYLLFISGLLQKQVFLLKEESLIKNYSLFIGIWQFKK